MARIITPDSAKKETRKALSLTGVTSPRLAKKQVSPTSPTSEVTVNRKSKSPPQRSSSGTPVLAAVPLEQSKSEITQPSILSRPASSPTKVELEKATTRFENINNFWDLGLGSTKSNTMSPMPPNVPFHQRANYGALKYDLILHKLVKLSPDEVMVSMFKDGFLNECPPYEAPSMALSAKQTRKLNDLKNSEIDAAKWRNQLESSEQAGGKLRGNTSYILGPDEVNHAIDHIVRNTGPAHGRFRPKIPDDIEMMSPSCSQTMIPRCMRKHPVNEPPKMDEGDTSPRKSPKEQRKREGDKKGETHFPILVDRDEAAIRVQNRLTKANKILLGDEERYRRDNSRRLRDLEGYEEPPASPQTPPPERPKQKETKTKRQNNKTKGKRQVSLRQGREKAEHAAAAAAHSDLQMDTE